MYPEFLAKFLTLQEQRQVIVDQLNEKHIIEQMRSDCIKFCAELRSAIEGGERSLGDADAVPSMYIAMSDTIEAVLDASMELNHSVVDRGHDKDDRFAEFLSLYDKAVDVGVELRSRVDTWRLFVEARDAAAELLEVKRQPLNEIQKKSLRSKEEVSGDLDKLKVRNFLKHHIKNVLSLFLSSLIRSCRLLRCIVENFR